MAEFEKQALSPSVERYTLDGSEDNVKFAYGTSVVVTIENAENRREFDSPRIHTKFITEFKGDSRVRAHYDPLLTIHKNYIACLVHLEQSGDVVRVIDRVSRQRQFVKTFISTPISLLFSPTTPHLAVLDQLNNLYVFTVGSDCNVEQFITITNWPVEEDDDEKPILAWCPYIPDESTADDSCLIVAIAKGKKVYLVNLEEVHRNGHTDQVDFSKVTEDADTVLTIELDQKVVTMTISPDATAMAIATENGIVTFYTLGVSQDEIKLAQHWNPLLKSIISNVFFLDDVADSNTLKTFWKHCLVVGENGHRLALYDCLTWKSIGSLRFDCSLDLSSFHVCVDPKVRYVHLSEKDGGNVFCVELENDGVPRFLSITQLTFCRPLSAICPYDVTDQQENVFEDVNDGDNDGDNDNIEKLFIHYVAVSQRGIAELEVQMDKTENNAHSISEAGDGSAHGSDMFRDIPTVDTVQLHLPSTSELMNVEASGSARSWMDRDDIELRFNELHSKLDQMASKMEQNETQRNASYTNEQILQLLHQFKDEFSLREDRLLANVSDLVETSRIETLNAVRNVLNENAIAMENNLQANQKQSMEYVSQKVSERVVESFATVILPSVDRMCGQLFKQMNETFRLGLEQYMTQFRAFHQAALNVAVNSTPVKPASVSADRQQLAQMIKNKQHALAFETVLNQGDLSLLDFVCNGIDPDEFFGSHTLPEAVLLPLLQQLSLRLDVDTDHKFRYLEHILVKLRPEDMDSNIVQNIMHGLNKSLMDIHTMAADPAVKRSARMLITLTKNYLRN